MPDVDGGKKKKVKKVSKSSSSHHATKFVYDAVNKDGEDYTFIPYKQFLGLDKALDKIKKTKFSKSKVEKLPLGAPLLLRFKKDNGDVSNYTILFYVGYDKGNNAILTCKAPPLMAMSLFYAVAPNARNGFAISETFVDRIDEDGSYIIDTNSIVWGKAMIVEYYLLFFI